jgi:hypothetical protein
MKDMRAIKTLAYERAEFGVLQAYILEDGLAVFDVSDVVRALKYTDIDSAVELLPSENVYKVWFKPLDEARQTLVHAIAVDTVGLLVLIFIRQEYEDGNINAWCQRIKKCEGQR